MKEEFAALRELAPDILIVSAYRCFGENKAFPAGDKFSPGIRVGFVRSRRQSVQHGRAAGLAAGSAIPRGGPICQMVVGIVAEEIEALHLARSDIPI